MNRKKITACLIAAMGVLTVSSSVGQCAELSIDDAVAMAIERNPEVAITAYGEKTAKARLKKARAANSFSGSLSANASRTYAKTEGISHESNTFVAPRISLSLPVYTGGKNEANIESGELGIEIAKLNTLRQYETMRYNVIKAYYDVLEAEEAVKIQQDEVDKYQKHLTNTEQLFSAGSKAKIDVLRSPVELTNSQQSLVSKQSDYSNKLNKLRNYLYMDQHEPVVLTDKFVYNVFEPTVDDCVSYAMKNRKDLMVDEYTLKQKELAVKAAKAGYKPTVNLSASTNWDHSVLPDGDNHNVTVGVSANWNFFDSGVTAGELEEAEIEVEKARLTVNKDKNSVELDLRSNYNSMREAEKNFSATKNAVKKAEEEYFIATEKYRAGEGIMLDIIDAQTSLSTARQNYMTAQYNYARYKAAVENGMGLDGYELEG